MNIMFNLFRKKKKQYAHCLNCGERLSDWFVHPTIDGLKMWCYIYCETISPWSSHKEWRLLNGSPKSKN